MCWWRRDRPSNRPLAGEPLEVRLGADVPLAVEDGNRTGDSERHWGEGTNAELRIHLWKCHRENLDIFIMPILYVYRGQRKIGPRRDNYDVRPVFYPCPQ